MVRFTRLSIRNFRRFSGDHEISLSGDGRVTVIAAENGVGKTTTMEAMHIALYGRRGFEYLHPGEDFESWLDSAYSVDGKGDRHILLALDMKDDIMGGIRISRTFWLLGEEYGGMEEEVGVEVGGKPLEREAGESRLGLAERWIEDYLPHSAMRRFLVDGERLSDLDPKRINDEIVDGIDDIIGIGLLRRISKRVSTVKRRTLKELAPEDKEDTLESALDMLDEKVKSLSNYQKSLAQKESVVTDKISEISDIQEEIESITIGEGGDNVQLRMQYAISQSELTSSRKDLQRYLTSVMPLIIAGVPSDLEEWGSSVVLEAKYSSERSDLNKSFLEAVIEESGVTEEEGDALLRAGDEVLAKTSEEREIDSPLSVLPLNALEEAVSAHSRMELCDAEGQLRSSIDEAIERLEAFEEAEESLRRATRGTDIGTKAERLRELSTELGTSQAEAAVLRGEIERMKSDKEEIEAWVGRLRDNDDPESLLNRRASRIDDLSALCDLVMETVRSDFAQPLEEAFSEGFELLSRKAGKLEGVSIDTSDYSTHLSMRGFEGNWLDRGLSATERQHVGLALIYALRRASTKWSLPLPVVVDTPTSRMDRKHKSWSVTKFYPQLSNQVIVFATSDDLADGLFEELKESGSLGGQMVIREVSDNSVEVIGTDLSTFFGGQ